VATLLGYEGEKRAAVLAGNFAHQCGETQQCEEISALMETEAVDARARLSGTRIEV